ncbi:hypothetical protein ANN_21043 [Periplaneta americana]|uniref:Reverse transcriptase domain-containing protein n=1 Tax=Periplaneta americana TaxID=6978 RepID=A0ABQ8SEX6_PERAM|nr:hypothetical protein ANN_21043 [Periplaneta americana]
MYKIFTYILRKRLEKYYENIIGEYQAGFRAGRSTIDQIYTVKGMTEKFWEYNLNLYHLFVDFRTAYDSINRQGLYKIMIHQGIHPKIIVILTKMTMAETKAQVNIYGGSTEQFNIDNGLKQGDALAPMLFNLALHWVITQTGINTNSTLFYKSVQIVGYADDLDVMGRSLTAIEEVYKDLEQGAAKIGLQINASKTKRMTQIRNKQNIYNPPNLTINMFEETEKFKYLRTVMTSNNNELIEVQSRITAANKAYFALSAILKSNCVHKEPKLKIYKTIIRSILCYASETWTLSKETEAKLGIFERKILRSIFGSVQENMQWRIRYNNELYKLYKSFDIVTFIKLRRLEWAGHVYRMEGNRIPKKILEGKIHGKRPIGRPKNRWIDASLMLAGNEFQSLGRAIVKEDGYEVVRWDGIVSIVSWRERVFRLWCEERSMTFVSRKKSTLSRLRTSHNLRDIAQVHHHHHHYYHRRRVHFNHQLIDLLLSPFLLHSFTHSSVLSTSLNMIMFIVIVIVIVFFVVTLLVHCMYVCSMRCKNISVSML